jgi:hypothetical protein
VELEHRINGVRETGVLLTLSAGTRYTSFGTATIVRVTLPNSQYAGRPGDARNCLNSGVFSFTIWYECVVELRQFDWRRFYVELYADSTALIPT